MQLLTKNEVADAKNLDRKREIDEGVKLALKVDALRQAAATEEARLNLVRASTLAQVQKDIADITQEKISLSKEVEVLEHRKVQALKPLEEEHAVIKKEWEQIGFERTSNDHFNEALNSRANDVYARQMKLEDDEKDLVTRNEEVEERMAHAEHLESAALEGHAEMLAASEASTRQHSQAFAAVTQREILVSSRERDAEEREAILLARAKEQSDERRRLTDLSDTLTKAEQYGKRKQR